MQKKVIYYWGRFLDIEETERANRKKYREGIQPRVQGFLDQKTTRFHPQEYNTIGVETEPRHSRVANPTHSLYVIKPHVWVSWGWSRGMQEGGGTRGIRERHAIYCRRWRFSKGCGGWWGSCGALQPSAKLSTRIIPWRYDSGLWGRLVSWPRVASIGVQPQNRD